MDRYDRWLSRLVRTAAAFIGLGTFVYEVRWGGSLEFALVGIGVAGLPLGHSLERFLSWVTSLRPSPIQDHRIEPPISPDDRGSGSGQRRRDRDADDRP